ncbi:MAG TPA: RHS repeat-associated core domain-containing protein, partial [Longimicrobiaceae bacterium]|nr:RHS repeat-associated core domain-containing protein [Longimicrobiaceae bacterium]
LEEYAEAYAYDGSGNLLSTAHTAASGPFTRESPVEPDSNRLSGVPYDGSGNPLEIALLNTVGLAWDYAGRLASSTPVERPDGARGQDFYTYDAVGDRVRAGVERTGADGAAAGSEERISLGGYGVERVRGTDEAVDELRTLRVMDGAGCVAVVETGDGVRRVRWQLGDRLGSVSVELDDAGAPATYEAFFPYGGTPAIAGTDPATVEPKRRRYSAKECDDSTGLYDYGARWYATWLGRWLSPDPSGPVDGLNLYAFVRGNPLAGVDPDGRKTYSIADLSDAEIFDALKDLKASILAAASKTMTIGPAKNYPPAKLLYGPVTITKFMEWNDTIATLKNGGWRNLAVGGTGSQGVVFAQWKGSNFEVKGGGTSSYATYSDENRTFFKTVRRKILGKEPIALVKKSDTDYFAAIAALGEGQRDTLGSIASVIAIHNTYKAASDQAAKNRFKSYWVGSQNADPELSFARKGGQKILTDIRENKGEDLTFKTNLASITRTYLGLVNTQHRDATSQLANQTYQSQAEVVQAVKDVLHRKFKVTRPQQPPQQQQQQVQPQVQQPVQQQVQQPVQQVKPSKQYGPVKSTYSLRQHPYKKKPS